MSGMMNILLAVIPIIIPSSGNSAPLTQHQKGDMIGVFIFINIIWAIIIIRQLYKSDDFWYEIKEFDISLFSIVSFIMLIIWGSILTFSAGHLINELFLHK